MRIVILCSFSLLLLISCRNNDSISPAQKEVLQEAAIFHQSLDKLTDVIVHDIFSPPVASRVYVYPCIAAFETLAQKDDSFDSYAAKLTGLSPIPKYDTTTHISLEIAAISAFITTAKALVFSEDKLENYEGHWTKTLDSIGISKHLIDQSKMYGQKVAAHILEWADKDNYKQTRSAPKFNITDKPGEWKPTPPAYMEGIEPHWREIRTMVLTEANQFNPGPPPTFDVKKGSDFMALTEEVKDAVDNATEEHKSIASFWDCNPYVMNQTGHMMFASKKITPGGHWMGISSIASRKKEFDLIHSAYVASMTAIGLFDGFISCWDEKYRSNLIRPESVINTHLDPDWKPFLQTPPFPEHTSGHSVISSAAAVILTEIIGDNFAYVDDVEVKYGLPIRSFSSFYQASDEAAISRLYGGIHYMPAITQGVSQGKKVGKYIIENVSIKKGQ